MVTASNTMSTGMPLDPSWLPSRLCTCIRAASLTVCASANVHCPCALDPAKFRDGICRFDPPSGPYSKLLEDGIVKEYAVLDFRAKPIWRAHTSEQLSHVVFDSMYETSTLWSHGRQKTLHVRGSGSTD